ncbi:ribonuclease H-like domain-containing protein [Hypoxylon sp. FL0543]|nr:ribonuclease H-like domain-containing protein [Hypoxylon sp. FL0543]
MVIVMNFYVDGGCRGNGTSWAIGAAAACTWSSLDQVWIARTEHLDTWQYRATNHRAEVLAVIIALQWSLRRLSRLTPNSDIEINIFSDSSSVVNTMRSWIHSWFANGWVDSRGGQVAHQDLLRQALVLDHEVSESATINYIQIPRELNRIADAACNDALDEQGYYWRNWH